MKNLFLFLSLFTTMFFIGCGDEGVILEAPINYDNAPSAPSIYPAIPFKYITHIETAFADRTYTVDVYATYKDSDYVATYTHSVNLSGSYTKLEGGEEPRHFTYSIERAPTSISEYVLWTHFYYAGGPMRISTNVGSGDFRGVGDGNDPVEPANDPVNDPVDDPVDDPVNDPVDDPVNDHVDNPVIKDEPPVVPKSIGGYVVWLEKVNGNCQSGVIHSDYVFINYENKTITFTGVDGQVDPDDTVRTYIKVETGFTYEQASKRAPEILSECSR